jgi:hypothetical protein
VQGRVDELRRLVGLVEVDGAEPGAEIAVDGLQRGEYPLAAPLRARVGTHVVRVVKEGFEPFEARVEVAGGKLERVDARLRPLRRAGRLRVIEQSGRALVVLVDGSVVGKTPWDGQLSPGEHAVALRGEGDVGTPPMRVVVEESRTVPLTLSAEELAAALRVEPVPANATVAIDGVTVGRGVWEGRLRAGPHRIEIAAPGFLPASEGVDILRGEQRVARIDLRRDPRSPFHSQAPRFTVEIATGVPLLVTFAGEVATSCTNPCRKPLEPGVYAVARGGYELGSRIAFGVAGGYVVSAVKYQDRTTSFTSGSGARAATVGDSIWMRTAIAGAWGQITFGDSVPFHLRLGAGALVGSASDSRTGTLLSTPPAPLAPATETHAFHAGYIAPEIRLGLALGPHAELSLGIDMLLAFNVSPPTWSSTRTIAVLPAGPVGRYPSEVYSSTMIVTFSPALGARYDF